MNARVKALESRMDTLESNQSKILGFLEEILKEARKD
jgi:hypothetical protein